mmetsp:Transcript_24632/g.62168  ORF Transcript_24632/g.62168 Transcript_24632/m.62168 type:complete len:232 (+) Transcript_24632:971-1666(+)
MPLPSGVGHVHWMVLDVVGDTLVGLSGVSGPATHAPPPHDHPAVIDAHPAQAPDAPLSSHTSVPLSTPSPHTWHDDRSLPSTVVSAHADAASSVQSAAHPSPPSLLPSSHASVPGVRCPSPHTVSHALAQLVQLLVQFHPVSTSHAAEHPSPAAALPSSHCSLSTLSSPFMHPSLHVSGVSPTHDHPVCTLHVASQPSSPAPVLPSSHCSAPCRAPSPHTVDDRISALSGE